MVKQPVKKVGISKRAHVWPAAAPSNRHVAVQAGHRWQLWRQESAGPGGDRGQLWLLGDHPNNGLFAHITAGLAP